MLLFEKGDFLFSFDLKSGYHLFYVHEVGTPISKILAGGRPKNHCLSG